MSSVTQPRGPLPARVYWIRRGLVLGLALVLVFGLGRMLGGGSDGQDGDTPAAAQVGSEQTTDTANQRTERDGAQGEARQGDKKDKQGKRKGKRKPVLAEPDGPCAAEDITVEPLVKRAAADDAIRIRFAVTGAEPACTWEASPDSLVVKIISGRDLIWTSQQCPRVLPTREVVVRAEQPTRLAMTWNGRRSDEECSKLTDWALPGWYHVVAASLGGEPTDRQFELHRPPRETITKTADPKPKKKKQQRNG